jgi:hypothetical protein
MPYLKVRLSKTLRLVQPKACNKSMRICLEDCMILRDKSDKRIAQKEVFNVQYHASYAIH